MEDGVQAENPMQELGFALAEAQAEPVADEVRAKIVRAALDGRPPGRPAHAPGPMSGPEVFRRSVEQMDVLLSSLGAMDWRRPGVRDLTVQELVGHLIGAEHAFMEELQGLAPRRGVSDHVPSTQGVAEAQRGRPSAATHADWRERTALTMAACTRRPLAHSASYFGIVLPLDKLLVVRSFEIWVHHEDIRRAAGLPLQAPEEAALARMTQLAAELLPRVAARCATRRPGTSVRLVLTGPAGGTWDVPLGSPEVAPTVRRRDVAAGVAQGAEAVVVVDASTFCRVVANRVSLAGSRAAVLGDALLAEDLFREAASLAFD
jgi:uncharacterized protein (TIGR03083 family)